MRARAACRTLLLAWALVWAAPPPAATADAGRPEVPATLARAAREAAAGRFQSAAALLEGVAAAYPGDYQVQLFRAWYLLRAGAPARAEVAYRKALEASAGSPEALLGLADALAAQGRHDDDALELERRLLERRPDDPRALNRYAYAQFRAAHYRAAERFYARALALRPGDQDAQLGLGWCALRLGHRPEARARFQAVLAADPDNAGGREGLRWAGGGTAFTPQVYLFTEAFQGHPWRDVQLGASVAVDGVVEDHLVVGLSYRYLYLRGLKPRRGSGTAPSIRQHEVGAVVGWLQGAWGLALHGAYLHYAAAGIAAEHPGPDAGMVAASARHRWWWADLTLSLAQSFYDDLGVTQANAGALLPVLGWMDLVGGLEAQLGDGRVWPSGMAGARVHGASWFLAAGCTLGTRLRPVDLVRRTVYNTADRPSGSAWLRAGLGLGSGVSLHASYSFTRLLTPARAGGVQIAYGHEVSAGVSITLFQ